MQKQCPRCGYTAAIEARRCFQCGHEFRTQFAADGTRLVPAYAPTEKGEASPTAICALAAGVMALFAWLVPALGVPVSVVALALGISGMGGTSRGIAVAAVVLAVIGLVASIANAAIGAFLGYHGLLFR